MLYSSIFLALKKYKSKIYTNRKRIYHLGDGVAVIELVGGGYEGVCEPHVGDGDQKTLVKVISDSASVLNLTRIE